MSPSAELVAEGRIVYAGALADQGRIDEALALLRKRADPIREPEEYHLRLWYALGRPRGAGRQPRPRPGALRPGAPRRSATSPTSPTCAAGLRCAELLAEVAVIAPS